MDENDTQDAARRAEQDPIGHGRYGPGALEEVTVPPADPSREAQQRDVQDPADIPVDPEELADGGPNPAGGAVTTTGGSAGPASVRRRPGRRRGGKVAPTTTGDATSGGMSTPAAGPTSDAASGASIVGNFSDRRRSRG